MAGQVTTTSIPVNNQVLVRRLRQYLVDTRYATYARLMSMYPVAFDADPKIAPAYTDGTAIHIAQGMNLAEQSLVVRHELLHILLKHKEDTTWKKGQDDHMVRNIAGDAELSNYYDDEDNALFGYDGPLSQGINVHVNNGEWKGKTAPEIYRDLDRKRKKDKGVSDAVDNYPNDNPFGDCSPKDIPPQLQQPGQSKAGKPTTADELTKEQAKAMLEEIIQQSHEQTTKAFDGPEYGGTVDRKFIEARTSLYISLTRYFAHDLSLQPRRTYSSPHKQSTPNLMRRGRRRRYVEDKTLVVYIDRSGSMTDDKTGKADRIVENTTKRLRDVKIIKKYFANRIGEDEDARKGFGLGGGTNYEAVANDITAHGYKSVAIITDNDYSNIWKHNRPRVDMAWICAVGCQNTMIAGDIISNKTVLEVAL